MNMNKLYFTSLQYIHDRCSAPIPSASATPT